MIHSAFDPQCIFCKIARGEIPSVRVYETDRAIAILDINPVNKGHVLVIPRMHFASLADLPESLGGHLGSLLPTLATAIMAATSSDGFNVIVNSGRAAGQTVDHCHIHIVPRFVDDAVDWPWPHGAYVSDELEQMRARIVAELGPPRVEGA